MAVIYKTHKVLLVVIIIRFSMVDSAGNGN